MKRVWPATVATLIAAAYVAWRLANLGWDPVALFEIGTRFSEGDPNGSEGYDGQFSYYIASDPDPATVAEQLDVPAYRYQRILFPLLSRLASFGSQALLPWAMLLGGLAAHWVGTWSVASFLEDHDQSPWYSMSYGLWVGLVAPIGIGLGEPLAYALASGGWLLRSRQRPMASAILLGMAVFAKETTLVFLAAAILAEALGERRRGALGAYLVAVAAFGAWQLWLESIFGSFGIASGGAMATGFELIPFMGLFRIGSVSPQALLLFLAIFLPTIVLPTIWAAVASIRRILAGSRTGETWSLLANSLAIMVLPFSTFREPLGVVRFASGLVLAVVLFSAVEDLARPLRYSLFWSGLLVILVSQ